MSFQYPFDYTGVLPENYIVNESRSITTGNGFNNYCVVPSAAPFFAEGFTLVDAQGHTLIEGDDYLFCYPVETATLAIGKPIYGGYVFVNPNYSGQTFHNYHTIGGIWVENKPAAIVEGFTAIAAVITLDWSTMPFEFPPTPHSHALTEGLAGMNQIKVVLEQIQLALENTDRRIYTDDVEDLGIEFIAPVLAKLSDIAASLAGNGTNDSVINDLVARVQKLDPFATVDGEENVYKIPIGGFFHVIVGRIAFTPPSSPLNLTFGPTFSTKCIAVHLSVCNQDENATVALDKIDIAHSAPTTSGIDSIRMTMTLPAPTATAPRWLQYIAIGI